MFVTSPTFFEIYARHAVPILAREQRAQEQRVQLIRHAGTVEVRPGLSPLAPPYQVYPPRPTHLDDQAA